MLLLQSIASSRVEELERQNAALRRLCDAYKATQTTPGHRETLDELKSRCKTLEAQLALSKQLVPDDVSVKLQSLTRDNAALRSALDDAKVCSWPCWGAKTACQGLKLLGAEYCNNAVQKRIGAAASVGCHGDLAGVTRARHHHPFERAHSLLFPCMK